MTINAHRLNSKVQDTNKIHKLKMECDMEIAKKGGISILTFLISAINTKNSKQRYDMIRINPDF